MSEPAYRVVMASSAERALARLPEKVVAAVVEFVTGALVDAPRVVGHPLRRELMGLWVARRGPYRVVYEIDDDTKTVNVLRVEHRADVYRSH